METTSQGDLIIRAFRDGDDRAVLDMLRQVYRLRHGIDLVGRDLALWRWQHLQNPAGTELRLATTPAGRVVSLYAAVPRVADTDLGERRFLHVLHTLTRPEVPAGAERDRLLAMLAHAFESDCAHDHAIGYGMPPTAAAPSCRSLFGYRALRDVEFWLRPTTAALPKVAADVLVRHVDVFPQAVDTLWRDALPVHRCSVRKDHRYLQWRYDRHPERADYARITAWRGERLTGALVLQTRDDLVPDTCAVAELLCSDEDDDTALTLLREASRLAARRGRALLAVFADHDPNAARMAVAGAHRAASGNWAERTLNLRILAGGVTPDVLATHWRYSLGDTDLC